MYKISIILPIFNVENLLERSLNSIINQTMDLTDIEIIMVDDCSTDNSQKIMKKYSEKYPNFISLFHEKNSGGCGIPRNTGMKIASGKYIMFLDPDDEYLPENCEKLYNAITKYDGDIAFGRYERSYPHLNKFEISDSPYPLELDKYFSKEKFDNIIPIKKGLKQRVINYFNSENNEFKEAMNEIYAKNLQGNFELITIAPSVWTKIYKKEFLWENNFQFQRYAAEDVVFVLQTFNKANGIIFLNDFAGYKYYKYASEDNESMTNVVSFKLLDEICSSYITCATLTKTFPNNVRSLYVNSQITHWFLLWRNSNLNKFETKILIKKLNKLKKEYKVGLKTKLLFTLIINYIKLSNLKS